MRGLVQALPRIYRETFTFRLIPRSSERLLVACAADRRRYALAVTVTFFYLGTVPFLVVPVACFGLYLAVRFLWRSSVLAYLFAGCSFVFWLVELFSLSQSLATYARP